MLKLGVRKEVDRLLVINRLGSPYAKRSQSAVPQTAWPRVAAHSGGPNSLWAFSCELCFVAWVILTCTGCFEDDA